ncbi:MAG: quinate 5-dehydrogenase [Armatimonadota bacterium]
MGSMKRVVSISLGASSRDKWAEIAILGQRIMIERLGTNGSLARFERLLRQFDGVADVLCLGGINLGIHWGEKYFPYRYVQKIVSGVRHGPVVDGSGLKRTLEPMTVQILAEKGLIDYSECTCLFAGALDRYWLLEALSERCNEMIIGDLMFLLGLPVAIDSMQQLQQWLPRLLPVIARMPHGCIHRTGRHGDEITPRFESCFDRADVIAGDFVTFRHCLPDDLSGRVIITNTTTSDDEMLLSERNVRLLVTTTPVIDRRAFATNVMEGVFVSLLNRPPEDLGQEDYLYLAREMQWRPEIRWLTPGDANE